MPDPKAAEAKELAALGTKDSLAAVMAMRYYRYLRDQDVVACASLIDAHAGSNPQLLAEVILSNALPIPPRKQAIIKLQQSFPNSYLANLVYARLLRNEQNADHGFGLPTAPLADRFLARVKPLVKNNPDRPAHILSLALFYEGTGRFEEAGPL